VKSNLNFSNMSTPTTTPLTLERVTPERVSDVEVKKFTREEVREVAIHIEDIIRDELPKFFRSIFDEIPEEDEDGNEDDDLQAATRQCADEHLQEDVVAGVQAFAYRLIVALVELKATDPTPAIEISTVTRAALSPLAREIVDHFVQCILGGIGGLADQTAENMPGEDELVEAAHDYMQTHLEEEVMVGVNTFADRLQTALHDVEKTRREARKKGKKNKAARDCMICVGGGECVRHAKKAKA
jgi:hypothetical protein